MEYEIKLLKTSFWIADYGTCMNYAPSDCKHECAFFNLFSQDGRTLRYTIQEYRERITQVKTYNDFTIEYFRTEPRLPKQGMSDIVIRLLEEMILMVFIQDEKLQQKYTTIDNLYRDLSVKTMVDKEFNDMFVSISGDIKKLYPNVKQYNLLLNVVDAYAHGHKAYLIQSSFVLAQLKSVCFIPLKFRESGVNSVDDIHCNFGYAPVTGDNKHVIIEASRALNMVVDAPNSFSFMQYNMNGGDSNRYASINTLNIIRTLCNTNDNVDQRYCDSFTNAEELHHTNVNYEL